MGNKPKKDKTHSKHAGDGKSKTNDDSHHVDNDKSEMNEMEHPHVDEEYYKNLIDPEIPIDCPKEMGADFEDCKMPWGWDCCVKSPQIDFTDFAKESNSDTDLSQFKDPLGCTEEYGPRFTDCEREWGWDCCFVDDNALFTDYDDAVIIVDDDLMILDDFFEEDDSVITDSNVTGTEDTGTQGAKKNPTDFKAESSSSKTPLGCSKLYNNNDVYDCEKEWGWDCCIAGDAFLADNSWEEDENQIDLTQDDGNILGVLVVMVMITYVIYSLSMRFCCGRRIHGVRIGSVKSYKRRKMLIPEYDDDDDKYDDCFDDSVDDEEIELRPLI